MRSSILRWALVPLALIAGAVMTANHPSAPTGADLPVANPALLKVYQTTSLPNNEPLPPVAARLGEVVLTGPQLAERVAEARYNDTRAKTSQTESQIRRAALEGWLRQAAVHERAKAEGIVATDAEVHEYMLQQARGRHSVLSSNQQSAADYQAYVEARGYKNPDDYDRDPRAIEAARWFLEASKLMKKDLPASATEADQETFIETTMSQAKVQTFISFG